MMELGAYVIGAFISWGFLLFVTDDRDCRKAAFLLAVFWPLSLAIIFGGVLANALRHKGAK